MPPPTPKKNKTKNTQTSLCCFDIAWIRKLNLAFWTTCNKKQQNKEQKKRYFHQFIYGFLLIRLLVLGAED